MSSERLTKKEWETLNVLMGKLESIAMEVANELMEYDYESITYWGFDDMCINAEDKNGCNCCPPEMSSMDITEDMVTNDKFIENVLDERRKIEEMKEQEKAEKLRLAKLKKEKREREEFERLRKKYGYGDQNTVW